MKKKHISWFFIMADHPLWFYNKNKLKRMWNIQNLAVNYRKGENFTMKMKKLTAMRMAALMAESLVPAVPVMA